MKMRAISEKGIEIEVVTYLECTLCYDIIDKDNESFYLWEGGRLASVCRNCARKLFRRGERILGITKLQRKERPPLSTLETKVRIKVLGFKAALGLLMIQ
jgi:hypothetical protein